MNIHAATFMAAYGRADQLPAPDCPEIAFSGRSNVGKSSLINKVLERKNLARVSGTPGKTVTINFYSMDSLRLVDLPGYGYARRSEAERKRWSQLAESYFTGRRDIRLVVQLLDMRHDPSADDHTMLRFLADTGTPALIVLTKCDKLGVREREERVRAFSDILTPYLTIVDIIQFSSLRSIGVEAVRNHIERIDEESRRRQGVKRCSQTIACR